ncbi:MAG: hypothetical protein PHC66_01810 [Candidatus Nanoarchaeia archaeon]|nr:hypothetical protein [Candidatus Nanoarchaeia archaeon]
MFYDFINSVLADDNVGPLSGVQIKLFEFYEKYCPQIIKNALMLSKPVRETETEIVYQNGKHIKKIKKKEQVDKNAELDARVNELTKTYGALKKEKSDMEQSYEEKIKLLNRQVDESEKNTIQLAKENVDYKRKLEDICSTIKEQPKPKKTADEVQDEVPIYEAPVPEVVSGEAPKANDVVDNGNSVYEANQREIPKPKDLKQVIAQIINTEKNGKNGCSGN